MKGHAMLKTLIAAAALLASVAAASAADPRFCANYSSAAVKQAEVAHRTPPCAPGAIGTRWSVDYRVHYSWCITAAFPAVEAERDMRTSYLRSCRR
jgi:hypothetical protein